MGLRDFLGQVRSGITGGPTPAGSWGDQEKFGRFEGTGEVTSEAPDDDTSHSLENLRAIATAEIELPGLYRLTVRAPNGEEPLLILAGG